MRRVIAHMVEDAEERKPVSVASSRLQKESQPSQPCNRIGMTDPAARRFGGSAVGFVPSRQPQKHSVGQTVDVGLRWVGVLGVHGHLGPGTARIGTKRAKRTKSGEFIHCLPWATPLQCWGSGDDGDDLSTTLIGPLFRSRPLFLSALVLDRFSVLFVCLFHCQDLTRNGVKHSVICLGFFRSTSET